MSYGFIAVNGSRGVRLDMEPQVTSGRPGCLQIMMANKKKLQVEWSVTKATVPRWKRVQVAVADATRLVYIVGAAGRDRGISGKSYIAIDDVFITSRECTEPGMSAVVAVT